MIGGFRQSMAWLHTWSGLVFCWILYFMFVTGTLGYFDTEIDRWMQPEQVRAEPVSLDTSIAVASRYLAREAEGAERWSISPPHGREPHLSVFFEMPKEGEEQPLRGKEKLDTTTGEPLPELDRATGGGQALYRMHYVLHYLDREVAFRFVGFIAMLMLVAIISGIVIHKKIFKELFTFRPRKGQRSWLDAHNLLSVASLPFQLVITYSGLLFTIGLWLPMIGLASYGFDSKAPGEATNAALGELSVERSGQAAALADLNAITRQAEARWGPGGIGHLEVHVPGDANARVTASRRGGVAALKEHLIFDGTTGELLESRSPHANAPVGFASTMVGLHEGHFAGPLLRWLYVLWGLLGCAMVATGAIYWTAKRKKKMGQAQSLGYRFVDAINVGTIVGLPVGVAAYFWANRLLPLGMEDRAEWEMHCLFLVWAVCLLHPVFRPREKAWREQAWLAAFAFGALPILNALTTNTHLGSSLARGDWVLAGFDLSTLVTGAGFAATALVLGRSVGAKKPEAVAIGKEVEVP